jgi:hypothetical protein
MFYEFFDDFWFGVDEGDVFTLDFETCAEGVVLGLMLFRERGWQDRLQGVRWGRKSDPTHPIPRCCLHKLSTQQ